MSEIEETAKATQAVAKTVNNVLDKAEKAGTFMAKYIDAPLSEITGIWNDKLKYRRWENQLNFWIKANKKLKDLGLENPSKELPLKLGLPLIEAVSLEENDELQELWANLLVNSSTEFTLERSYISVLEQLSSLEVNILITIYSTISFDDKKIYKITTIDLPNKIDYTEKTIIEMNEEWNNMLDFSSRLKDKKVVNIEKTEKKKISVEPKEMIRLALSNLTRLQCILPELQITGEEQFALVNPTLFGAKLYEAVKEPKK